MGERYRISSLVKSKLLSQAVVEMTQLQHLVTDRQLHNSLQRHLAQISKRDDAAIKRQRAGLIEVECLSGTGILNWKTQQLKVLNPLKYSSLKKVWGIMSESMFLTLEDICKFLATDITSENISFAELAFQLLKLFTVMAGSFARKGRFVINIHEMVLTPGAFEIIFNFHEDDTSVCSTLSSNDVQTSWKISCLRITTNRRRRDAGYPLTRNFQVLLMVSLNLFKNNMDLEPTRRGAQPQEPVFG